MKREGAPENKTGPGPSNTRRGQRIPAHRPAAGTRTGRAEQSAAIRIRKKIRAEAPAQVESSQRQQRRRSSRRTAAGDQLTHGGCDTCGRSADSSADRAAGQSPPAPGDPDEIRGGRIRRTRSGSAAGEAATSEAGQAAASSCSRRRSRCIWENKKK